MAEPFARTDDYVAPRLETPWLRLPVRLLVVVSVIAALAGLGRMVGHPSAPVRRVRFAPAPAGSPVVAAHGWPAAARSGRSGTSTSATTTATTRPAATATSVPPTTAVPAAEPVAAAPPGFGCGAALAWLSSHAAPGFRFFCPGNAYGHQAMTCVDVAGVCPGQRIIAIADACPAAYMNEAHNSWVLSGLAAGRLDPYGWCG